MGGIRIAANTDSSRAVILPLRKAGTQEEHRNLSLLPSSWIPAFLIGPIHLPSVFDPWVECISLSHPARDSDASCGERARVRKRHSWPHSQKRTRVGAGATQPLLFFLIAIRRTRVHSPNKTVHEWRWRVGRRAEAASAIARRRSHLIRVPLQLACTGRSVPGRRDRNTGRRRPREQ